MRKRTFRNINSILQASLIAAALAGCSGRLFKSDTGGCKFRLTKPEQMLIGKYWVETSIEARRQEEDSAYTNITHQFMPSDLDDVMVFNKNGSYVFDEGKTKARAGSAQIYESGKWCVCKSGDKLILSSGPSVTTYEIVALEENLLVLQLFRNGSDKADDYLLRYEVVGME